MSTSGCMDREKVVYIHNGILLSHRKDGNPATGDSKDILWGYYAKRNKSQKNKYCMISLIHGTWKTPNQPNSQRRENRLSVAWGTGPGLGAGRQARWVKVGKRNKLPILNYWACNVSIVTIVNTVLYSWKLLRSRSLKSLTTRWKKCKYVRWWMSVT